MRRQTLLLTLAISTVTFVAMGVFSQERGYRPAEGFIPDKATAVRVAEAVLTPIYGEKQIKSEEPLNAQLKGGVWIITGTPPKGMALGGVAEIRISKRTGEILFVNHGM